MYLARTFPELIDVINNATKNEKNVLVEEFIGGKVASVHSVPHFRDEEIYTFPLGNAFGDPPRVGEAGFSSEEKEKLINLAKDIHNHTGAKHYLKSDFVLSPRGKVYLLGIELEPNLRQDSHFSEVCSAAGAKMNQVIEHILEQAIL
jgi:D-alanine-D-alanine ligase-like ATP-grasp enzyme